jgi:hypothetical protein
MSHGDSRIKNQLLKLVAQLTEVLDEDTWTAVVSGIDPAN